MSPVVVRFVPPTQLGAALREARTRRGVTLDALALRLRDLGVAYDAATLGKFERCRKPLPLEVILGYAQCLRCEHLLRQAKTELYRAVPEAPATREAA